MIARAAAVAGIIFSVLLISALVLLIISVPADPAVPGSWLTGVVAALVLFVAVGITVWVELLFPAWILALSVDILVAGSRASLLAGDDP